jgi:ATP-binding cassette subfamily A (ABC1) protein 3
MMGLKDEIFHLSWFITYALQFALCSGIITACTMGSLFKYSDKTLVFTYFFLFGLSAIMLSFMISTFFTRAKTAVAVGTLTFLGAFFPYYTVNDESVSMVLKVVASLLSPTAFALGSINFADYERAHVGLRWSNIWRASSGVSFFVCLLMMLLDSILYCALGLYLDKVLPRENGVRYPWNFIFSKYFGRKKNNLQNRIPGFETDMFPADIEVNQGEPFDPVFESISLEMRQQELDGRYIRITTKNKIQLIGFHSWTFGLPFMFAL